MQTIIQAGISNVVLATALALIAYLAGRFTKRPHLSYLLWLLVLIKFVTPPIVSIPCIDLPQSVQPAPSAPVKLEGMVAVDPVVLGSPPVEWYQKMNWQGALLAITLIGSGVALFWSMFRAVLFHRAMVKLVRPVPPEVDVMARQLAHDIGLAKLPQLHLVAANTSPMVWWLGGAVRVLLPASLIQEMQPHQLRWVLAHELVHVRRRDHVVRWLECLAGVLFWWNPITWWARKELRVHEELCCDAEVLEVMDSKPREYANAILSVVEKLVCLELHPPVMASQMNSGGQLEQRMKMILNQNKTRKTSRIIRAGILLGAAAALPLGLTYAENSEDGTKSDQTSKVEVTDKAKAWYEGAKKKIDAKVKSGTMTQEEANKKLAYLRQMIAKKSDKQPNKKGAHKKPSIDEVKKQLAAAVKAGKITQEESDKKLKHYMAYLKKSDKNKTYSIDAVKKKCAAAVKAGKMTQEEADAKIEAYIKHLKSKKGK
jgi:beta-lactamase regulating signal transducer with metallopeptidase domain